MKKTAFFLFLFVFLLKGNDEVLKDFKPENKTIELKLKKMLEIDSATMDEKKPPFFSSARKSSDQKKIFILSRQPDLKIYCFNDEGVFINSFLTKGEGPGELLTLDSYQVLGDSVIASSNTKSIQFNIDGSIKEESRLTKYSIFCYFIDQNRYICNLTEREGSGDPVRNLVLLDKNHEEIITSFFRDEKRRDIGATMVLNNQLYHPMVTPDYKYAFLPGAKCLVCAVSDGNLLYLKDLQGKTVKTVGIDFKRRSMTRNFRNQLLETFKSLERFPDLYQGFLKKIPEKLLTVMYIKSLPKDCFAIFLGTGFEKYEVQVFDGDLNRICNLNFPESIRSRISDLSRINFFEKGFFVIENDGEENRYVEYQIENLKQIFN